MKDIIITRRRQRTELRMFLICFVIAFLLNVVAIIVYTASAWELITSIFYVLTFAVVLYVAWVFVRLLYYGIKRLNTKNNK